MKNEMFVEFSSLSQNESLGRMVAAAFVAQLNPTVEELSDVRTAVSEAVTNAIIHGYKDMPGMVRMECTAQDGVVSIAVIDTGCGIRDVKLAMQPFYTSVPELERSGMGFAVMQAFMESVTVRSEPGKGTAVTMTKRIGTVAHDD